jgi:lipoprotein LpqB-like beta-propeller protein
VALDERLRREIAGAARPADPSGVYEDLIRRKERRRIARRIQAGGLAILVTAGTIGGFLALTRIFGGVGGDRVVPLTPSASANGSIAYTDGRGITVSAPDGSERRMIELTASGTAWHLAWSPDGSKLAIVVFDDPERSLWVMDADGSNVVEIATADNVGRPSWHPDNAHVTFSSERDGTTEVHVAAADGSDDQVVHAEDAAGTYAIFSSTFSPDGSEILFDAGTDVGYDLFVMDADGSNVRQLTRTGTDYNPSWSPDGSQIVFTRQEDASESDIFLMDADGSSVRRLTDGGPQDTNLDAQFSPDGTLITYEAGKTGGVGPIVAVRIDGSKPQVLVDVDVLGFSWQPLPESGEISPLPSPSPTERPGPEGAQDIGLGFPVCNVSSITGRFATPDATVTAFVATKIGDTGPCPQPEDALNVLALDIDRDGQADTSYGPIECTLECRTFSAPDVDGDGTDELLVVQGGGAVVGLRLYDVSAGGQITLANVAPPGDPEGGFEPGEQAVLLLGGDAFELYGLQCGDLPGPDGPGVIATAAESLPHDSPDAEWHAHETTLALRSDGMLHVVGVRDFTEPVAADPDGPSFRSGETLCGSNLGP